MNDTKVSAGFYSVSSVLGLIFIVLKLCGVICWPWIWVLAPFWISFCIWLVIILTVILILKLS